MNTQLSICIPTYNRGQFIGQTLESILRQKTKGVEIVIVDGGSKDETSEVVKSYQKRYENIKYYFQKVNRGIDRDMAKAVELARGEYCWLMSSDDIVKRGAIVTVLEACKKREYNLVIINSEIKNFDLSKNLKDKVLNVNEDLVFYPKDWEEFFIKTANYLSFMPSVVIRRDLWNSRKKEDYYGTRFLHVGVIFQKLIPGKILVLANPLLIDRYGNFTWSSKDFEIWMFKWPNLVWSFGGFSKEAKEKVCSRGNWRDILRLLYFKSRGNLTADQAEVYIRNYKLSGLKKFLIKIIPHLSERMLNLIALFYYSAIHKSREKTYLLKDCPAYYLRKTY